MSYTKLKKQEPTSYALSNLTGTLDVNNPINGDYLCANPWPINGAEVEAEPWIEVGKESISEIISQTVREVIKEKDSLVTPEIEKYHIKHR